MNQFPGHGKIGKKRDHWVYIGPLSINVNGNISITCQHSSEISTFWCAVFLLKHAASIMLNECLKCLKCILQYIGCYYICL